MFSSHCAVGPSSDPFTFARNRTLGTRQKWRDEGERERERVGRTEIDALLKEERPFSPQVAEDSRAGYFSSYVSSF